VGVRDTEDPTTKFCGGPDPWTTTGSAAVGTWTVQSRHRRSSLSLYIAAGVVTSWWRLDALPEHRPSDHSSIPQHTAGRLTKGTVAGGSDEWLTAGDVATYHKRRGITGDLWRCILLKLRRRQHVSYYTLGMAAAVHDCLFCSQVSISRSCLSKL